METWVMADGRWQLVQSGATDGAMFWPDFHANIADPPLETAAIPDGMRIRFGHGRAYHFWPRVRAALPVGYESLLCLVEARAVGSTDMLLGLGADYWKDRSAPWPNNAGVGVGHMRRLGATWDSYGFTTATLDALRTFF